MWSLGYWRWKWKPGTTQGPLLPAGKEAMEAGQGRWRESSGLAGSSWIQMNPGCGRVKIFVAIC